MTDYITESNACNKTIDQEKKYYSREFCEKHYGKNTEIDFLARYELSSKVIEHPSKNLSCCERTFVDGSIVEVWTPLKQGIEKTMEDFDTLLDTKEAAKFLGLKEKTLVVWRSTKHYPLEYIKVGGHVRYRLSVLKDFLKLRTINP